MTESLRYIGFVGSALPVTVQRRAPAYGGNEGNMEMRTRMITTAALAMLLIGVGATAANAASDDGLNSQPSTVMVDGHELGPEDGVKVTHESYEMVPGQGPVGAEYPTTPSPGTVTPQLVWGSSYAFAEEFNYVDYRGTGKAAANVFENERIVSVCFYWTRTDGYRSATTCSNASFDGGWNAGPEVIGWGQDTLVSDAPPTIFNIETTRIDPSAHW